MTLQHWLKVLHHFGIDPVDVYNPIITRKTSVTGDYFVFTFTSQHKAESLWRSTIIDGEVWRMHGLPGKVQSPIFNDNDPWYRVSIQRA